MVAGPGEDGKVIVYNSGTSSIRERDEMESCFDESPGDPRTALFRIDVIEIPLDNPAASKIVASPAVFADEETGALAGLWRGGDHGEETQAPARRTNAMTLPCFQPSRSPQGRVQGTVFCSIFRIP